MASTYRTVQGDTWDIISFREGVDIDALIKANYLHRKTVFFSAGVSLEIPDSTTTQTDTNLPPWRR